MSNSLPETNQLANDAKESETQPVEITVSETNVTENVSVSVSEPIDDSVVVEEESVQPVAEEPVLDTKVLESDVKSEINPEDTPKDTSKDTSKDEGPVPRTDTTTIVGQKEFEEELEAKLKARNSVAQPEVSVENDPMIDLLNKQLKTYQPSEQIKTQADVIYKLLSDKIDSLDITNHNFILLVVKCMEQVEDLSKTATFKTLAGTDKYNMTAMILNRLVDDVPGLSEDGKLHLRNLVPGLIETVIDASKGNLSKTKKKVKSMVSTDLKEIVSNLYTQLENMIQKENYSADYVINNMAVVISMVSSGVNKYKHLAGVEKKAIVLRTVKQLSSNLDKLFPDMSQSLKDTATAAQEMLPDLVDMLVSLNQHKFRINLPKCKGWFRKTMCCC